MLELIMQYIELEMNDVMNEIIFEDEVKHKGQKRYMLIHRIFQLVRISKQLCFGVSMSENCFDELICAYVLKHNFIFTWTINLSH